MGRRRKYRFYPALLSLILVITVSLLTYVDITVDKKHLLKGQTLLVTGDLNHAYQVFNKLSTSWWVVPQAKLGMILVQAMRGQDIDKNHLPPQSTIKIKTFQVQSLLSQLLASVRYQDCLRLSRIGVFYKDKISGLYQAASLLELGELKKSFDLFSKLEPSLISSSLGQRLKERLIVVPGAKQVVMDRNGLLIGTVNEQDEFIFAQEDLDKLIQYKFIRNIFALDTRPKGIRISIDLGLSRLALEALGENRGSIVIISIKTGEILAAVSDPLTKKRMGKDSSPALEQMLEPASIAKLLTTTAAFRTGLDPDQEISAMVCRGAKRYSGGILYCGSHKEESEGLVPAMATSCNIAFADLGIKLGWKSLIAEQRLFGLEANKDSSFPLGKILISRGNHRNLADLAIGLENTVTTPLHSAMIAAVFGNDGHLVLPHLIWGSDGSLGYSPKVFEKREGHKIVKSDWLPLIQRSMEAATSYGGTAGLVSPYDFPVAMKTGTAATYRQGFHVNYIGYAPADDPKIAFCVRITNQRRSVMARRYGYQVTHSILIKLRHFFRNISENI